jgi:hypothetical protein
MSAVRTAAEVRFGPAAAAEVSSFVRLNGGTHVMCCTYSDSAPILSIDDAHVRISVTVPDPGQVTAEDVQQGRLLAEAVARYVAELERCAASQDGAAGEAA